MSSTYRYSLTAGTVALVVTVTTLWLTGDFLYHEPPLSFLGAALDTRVWIAVAIAVFGAGLLLYVASLVREDPDELVRSGRSVEAIVPVYDEPAVLSRSVDRLAASTYEDLTVTIVCEPEDRATIDRAAALAAAHERVRHVINRRPGSKAGAINDAVERSDADVIALFDADQEPHPELIAHAMAALRDHDVARVRSLPRPTGLIESMAYYEYLLLFFLPQKLVRSVLGLGVVGTRSVLLERSVFEAVGGLEEGHLTEDIDFTHRCHRADLSIRELAYYPCFEEAAHTLRDWWGQRVRWMTGHVTLCHRQVREWRNLPDSAYLGSVLTLVATFVCGVVLSVTVPKLLLAALVYPGVVLAGLAALYGILLTTRAIDRVTAGLEGIDLGWLLAPVALTLFGLVVVRVIVGYAVGRETSWYRVEKRA